MWRSLSLSLIAACIVTRWFGPFYFTRFMCSLWESTGNPQEICLCLMRHMQHASCPMRGNDTRGETNVFWLRFFGGRLSLLHWQRQVGGSNGAGKFARLMIDWWTERRRDRGTDRHTERTHRQRLQRRLRLRLRLRLSWTDSCDDADLPLHWHSHLCNYARCTHTHTHIRSLAGKTYHKAIALCARPTCSAPAHRACNYFLLNLHHMRNMSKT